MISMKISFETRPVENVLSGIQAIRNPIKIWQEFVFWNNFFSNLKRKIDCYQR